MSVPSPRMPEYSKESRPYLVGRNKTKVPMNIFLEQHETMKLVVEGLRFIEDSKVIKKILPILFLMSVYNKKYITFTV